MQGAGSGAKRPSAISVKAQPGPRPLTMQEQTCARVRAQRSALIHLKRQGGNVQQALNSIIESVREEARSGCGGGGGAAAAAAAAGGGGGGMELGEEMGGAGGGGGGGGGGGASSSSSSSSSSHFAPRFFQQQLEGTGMPASGPPDDFCEGLTLEDHVALLLRLQEVLEEEEAAEAALGAAAQLAEHEEQERAEIEYLCSQAAGEEGSLELRPHSTRSMDEEERRGGAQ
jgi:hypothetical protein